ncbi:MAG: phosphoribosylglycinamide formyltransferase [Bacteriovoracaceae bacterium]|nr:phosphoribosylglycinamide formyltransferase [Deltaproteobacteria bacterium]MDI9543118.1 phosphoribosylglycinamide formyltransferase [Pseudomonadota bacterium]NLW66905.1 phosphoribosylglycinamide formyltransferase [Bacteriovoracaceae bacterium]HRR20361.1 phosphoribosylglycinamide formyltransferase [Desulfomonilia bacterium]HOE73918.1 phosphoribosylglycinamide formyltransferase [Deltaproteobacteria bacterium]
MIRIGALVSGSGTNLQSIMDACESSAVDAEVVVVISNVEGAYALERARKRSIPAEVVPHGDYPDRDAYDRELVRILRSHRVDLVVLAGFMRVLTPGFLEEFPERVMNIHPALLPSFPGLGVRLKAIEYGVRFSGCTVHFVDAGVDTGPIIIQAVVPVYPDDTEEELKDRILALEHKIYPKAIQLFAQGRLTVRGRKVFIRGLVKDDSQCLINPPLTI